MTKEQKQAQKKYRQTRREKIKEYMHAYYEKNKEKLNERHKAWREENKEKVNAYRRAWRAKKKEERKLEQANKQEPKGETEVQLVEEPVTEVKEQNKTDCALKAIEAEFGKVQIITAHQVELWLGIKDLNKTSIPMRMVGTRRYVCVQALAEWLS